jgi:hypothetical protein
MTYEEWLAENERLNAEINKYSDILNSFPRVEMGLIPDEVRRTDAYLNAKRGFDKNWKAARAIRSGKEWRAFVKRKGKETLAKRLEKCTKK